MSLMEWFLMLAFGPLILLAYALAFWVVLDIWRH
jgi:hypothetical protein